MSIRNPILHTLVAALVLAALPVACEESDDREDRIEPREGGYSGEELYLAIVFGQGEAAQLLPTVWGDCDNEARKAAMADLDEEQLGAALDQAIAAAGAQGLRGAAASLQRHRDNLPNLEPGEHPIEAVDFEAVLALIDTHDPSFFDRFAGQIQSGDHTEVGRALNEARDISQIVWAEVEIPGPPGDNGFFILIETFLVYDTAVVWDKVWFKTGFDPDSVILEEMMIEEIVGNFGY